MLGDVVMLGQEKSIWTRATAPRPARCSQRPKDLKTLFSFFAVLLKNGVKYVVTLNNSIFGKMGWWGCKTDQQFGSFF